MKHSSLQKNNFSNDHLHDETIQNHLGRLLWRLNSLVFYPCERLEAVWPDLVIYRTLGNFLKPLATIKLPQSPTFLGNFCNGVKIIHFSSETIFGQLLYTFGNLYLVTLMWGQLSRCFLGMVQWEKQLLDLLKGIIV